MGDLSDRRVGRSLKPKKPQVLSKEKILCRWNTTIDYSLAVAEKWNFNEEI